MEAINIDVKTSSCRKRYIIDGDVFSDLTFCWWDWRTDTQHFFQEHVGHFQLWKVLSTTWTNKTYWYSFYLQFETAFTHLYVFRFNCLQHMSISVKQPFSLFMEFLLFNSAIWKKTTHLKRTRKLNNFFSIIANYQM